MPGSRKASLRGHELSAAGVSRIFFGPDGSCKCDIGAEHLLGFPRKTSTVGLLRRVRKDQRQAFMALLRAASQTGAAEGRLALSGPEGDIRHVRAGASRVQSGTDEVGLEVILVDVTREQAEIELLKRSEENLRYIVEYNPQLPWIADADCRIIDFTDRWLESSGLDRSEATGTGWLAATHPEDITEVARRIEHSRVTGEPFDVRIRLLVNEQYRWMRAQAFPRRDDGGQIVRWYGYTEDIHESVLVEEQIRWNAEHDHLTELMNRTMFNRSLERALVEATQEFCKVGVLLIDIDNFKDVNDLMGHHAGDELLRRFAARLTDALGENGSVARLGGDEFAILLPSAKSRQAILDQAGQLLGLREAFSAVGRSVECQASIGAAIFPEDGRSATELFRHADLALYHAKSMGRGQLQAFEQSLLEEAQERVAMVNRARTAVRDGTILTYYQPKVCLKTGDLAGFEALLRWRDSTGKVRSPAEIYAAFDDHDVADMLGQTILKQVFADMAAWRANGLHFGHVAINVSSSELRRENFVERLLGDMRAFQIQTADLEIEITEGVFLGSGSDTTRSAIDLLHRNRIPLALDDFGTGFASLSHLRSLPVSTLKIDRSFVSEMMVGGSDHAIVSALITLGRALNMKVVAEGIEQVEQADALRRLGCEYAQGFYFGRPTPSEHVADLIDLWQPNRAPLNRFGGRLMVS